MKKFDKNFRKMIQEDKSIPSNINQLFLDFEMEGEKMEKNSKFSIMKIINKIIAIITALSVFSIGGVAFACAISENVRESIKAFLGIVSIEQYEEANIETNEIREDNGYTLTLENYGIDGETLLLSYYLNTKDEVELEYPFNEEPNYYFYDKVKIVNENLDEYVITDDLIHGNDTKYTVLLDKITGSEYKIYEIYSIDSSKITANSKLYLDFYLEKLQEKASGLDYNRLCDFKFEIPVKSDKISNNFEEYKIDNVVAMLDSNISYSEDFPNGETGKAIAKITKIKNSDIVTKLTVKLDGQYHTNTQYTLKLVDSNNNLILNRDIEYIFGGVEQDIIIPRIDMNSSLKITFYEKGSVKDEKTGEWTDVDIAIADMELDLSKVAQ